MTFDFEAHLRAARRSVVSLEVDGKAAHAVTLARPYATTVEDLWDAVTTPERLARWFLPVSGDLELGGRFKFEGNAEGEIRECQRPTLLATTWEIGGDTSWVRVELSSVETERALLTLTHTVLHSSHWDTY
ncbi:MAG: SRPBCC domain-containing protein, partial [Myxococcota bacterium]